MNASVSERRFERGRLVEVARVLTSQGTPIYVLPVQSFPGHTTNAYLVDHPSHRLLVDPGTARSHAQLVRRLDEAAERFGLRAELEDVDEVLFTHGHTDHYADAWAFRRLGIPMAIHELDARVLERPMERRALHLRDLRRWLVEVGLDPAGVQRVCDIYTGPKAPFEALRPERRLRHGDTLGAGWRVIHTPGHHPGHVCLAVDEVVLTGDHLLSRTTPVQTPAALVPGCGLHTYLSSLDRLERAGPWSVGLGAHDDVMEDVAGRIEQTRQHHRQRLGDVLRACAQPRTAAQVAHQLFGNTRGYSVLLALLETGAHLEHLHRLARVEVANLDEVTAGPAALLWRAL